MHTRQFSGRDYKTSRVTFNVGDVRALAVNVHTLRTHAGKYPVICKKLFEWLVAKEAELEFEPCSPEENQQHECRLALVIKPDPYGRLSKATFAMPESLMARFDEVCLHLGVSIITLIQTAIDETLSSPTANSTT